MKRFLVVALAAVMLCAMLTGCNNQNQESEIKKITVSEVTHSIFYAPMYAAINNGYFADEGIELELINAGGADKVMTSVITGAADIGFAGPEAVIYVCAQGKQDYPKVFAQLTRCDGSFLVGRESHKDFNWQSLKGSTILPGRKGGIPYMTLLYCLNKNGLEVGKDVFFDDSVRFDAMTGAFVSGTGDYVTVFEPGATALEKEGKGYVLASIGKEGGQVPYTTYFAPGDYISENARLIESFTKAIYKGQQFVQENSRRQVAQAIAYAFPETDVKDIETVVQRYKDIGAYSLNPQMSRQAYENLCAILKNAGELDKNVPFENIVDNSFAKKVMEQ